MNAHKSAIVVALLAGLVLGGAVQGLYAQAKPPVYFLAEIDVSSPEGYTKEYLPLVQPAIKAHGGRYLAAGSAVRLSGEAPKSRVVILAWDTMEQLQAWLDSADNQKARAVGEKHARFRNYVVPGVAQ